MVMLAPMPPYIIKNFHVFHPNCYFIFLYSISRVRSLFSFSCFSFFFDVLPDTMRESRIYDGEMSTARRRKEEDKKNNHRIYPVLLKLAQQRQQRQKKDVRLLFSLF
jgi:hypothetical protein